MELFRNSVYDGNRTANTIQKPGAPRALFAVVAAKRCRGRFETCPLCDYRTKGGSQTRPYSASCYDFCKLGASETLSDAGPTNPTVSGT